MIELLTTKNIYVMKKKTGLHGFLNKIGGYGCLERMGAVNRVRNKKYGGLVKVCTPIIAPLVKLFEQFVMSSNTSTSGRKVTA